MSYTSKRIVCVAIGACASLVCCRSIAFAQLPCPNDTDFVGLTVVDNSVILTTQARSIARDRLVATLRFTKADPLWRFRAIPFQVTSPIAITVNYSGASANVQFGAGPVRVVDLTRDIVELADESRHEPRLQFMGDHPRPCDMPAARRRHLAEQFSAFMEKRSGTEMTVAANVTWTFYQVAIDVRLYAPLLTLARQEIILPEDFEIWDRLSGGEWNSMRQTLGVSPHAGEHTTRALKTIYRRYRERNPDAPASIYFLVADLAGSWLIQYWFYYPFDEGGLDEHLHDSEHLFVEVDKLGGIVRRVVGAGHGDWAPNNEYGTFKNGVQEIELPLWALAEKGKHATAPDIDKDQQLTPGIDTNLYRDVGKVWGIRDATGQTDSALRPFGAAMMTLRRPQDQLTPMVWLTPSLSTSGQALEEQAMTTCPAAAAAPSTDRSGLRVLPRPRCYVLRPLVSPAPAKCGDPTALCARSQVMQHGDFKRSHHVLKQGFYPAVFPRVSASLTPTPIDAANRRTKESWRTAIGAGAEIAAIPIWKGKRLPLPGRLVGQVLVDRELLGQDKDTRFKGVTGHYELLLTNLFNGYLGMNWQPDDLVQEGDAELQGRSIWLTVGGGFERPINGRLGLVTQIGFAFNNVYGLRYESSAGLVLSFRNHHRRFGIERRAQNPFSH